MKVLVTGGCGYIGSNVCLDLFKHTNYELIIIDQVSGTTSPHYLNYWKNEVLEFGSKYNREGINREHKFYKGNCCDEAFLEKIFKEAREDDIKRLKTKNGDNNKNNASGRKRSRDEVDNNNNHNKNDNAISTNIGIQAVVHLAAVALVPKSLEDPLFYYENNIMGIITLLKVMKNNSCPSIVFASSCTARSTEAFSPINTLSTTINNKNNTLNTRCHPYGQTKRWGEEIIYQTCMAYVKENNDPTHKDQKIATLRAITLRFFNASGASTINPIVGEDHDPETHLIPSILKGLLPSKENNNNKVFHVFGTDYETRDGTCVRDFLHVEDIAHAIRLSLQKLRSAQEKHINKNKNNDNNNQEDVLYDCIPLGTGKGSTVREVVATCEKITKRKINVKDHQRRDGDVAVLVCEPSYAYQQLNKWRAEKTLDDIVSSAWSFHCKYHEKYFK